MRKLIVFLILTTVLLFFNCDRNRIETPVQITIINKTGVLLEIFVYKNSSEFVEKISLEDNDLLSRNFIYREGRENKGAHDFFQGDSVAIIFGNGQRIISYKCRLSFESEACNVNGNILNDQDPKWNFERIGDFIKRTYVFTEEDYENAAPCDGECN